MVNKIKWMILLSSLLVLMSITALAANNVRSVGSGPVFGLYPALTTASTDGLSNFAITSNASGVKYDAFLDGKKFFSSGNFTDFTISTPFEKPFYYLVVKAFGAYDNTSVATALIVSPTLGIDSNRMLNLSVTAPGKNGIPSVFVTVNSGFGRKDLTLYLDGNKIDETALSPFSDSPKIFEFPLNSKSNAGEHSVKAELRLITGEVYTTSSVLEGGKLSSEIKQATQVSVSKQLPPSISTSIPSGKVVWEKTAPAIVNVEVKSQVGSKPEVKVELDGTQTGTTLKIFQAGLYDLSVVAVDPKNDLRSSTNVKFRVSFDDTPPRIFGVTSSSTAGRDMPVVVSVKAQDFGTGVKDVTVNGSKAIYDGEAWIARVPATVTKISGKSPVELKIEASDALGNLAETSISTSVFVDAGRPYVKIDSNANSEKGNVFYKNSKPLVLTVKSTTDGGIPPKLSVELDGNPVGTAVSVSVPGNHTISVVATDTVSGLSSKYEKTFVVDFSSASQEQTPSAPAFDLGTAIQWLPAMVITIATVAIMLLTVLR